MKPVNAIDRSRQNPKNEVVETDVQKSGFNLTYRSHIGGIVFGRLYPQSVQHLMPNDKISGSNEANLTFNMLSTPVVDTIDVCVHNFLVTLRSIDNRWEKFMTPTKLNNMNVSVSVPTFSLTSILGSITSWLNSFVFLQFVDDSDPDTYYVAITLDTMPTNIWDNVYHSDALVDLKEQLQAILGAEQRSLYPNVAADRAVFTQFMIAYYDFFVGKRSLLDFFGYKMISRQQVYDAFNRSGAVIATDPVDYFNGSIFRPYVSGGYSVSEWLLNEMSQSPAIGVLDTFLVNGDTPVDYGLQNEYALRAYYAIWFEYYRNYDLEPRSNTLPEYRDFAGTTIFQSYQIEYLHYLVPRIRSWQQDAFITAGIDDISRHVFAPILDTTFAINADPDSSLQPTGILDNTVRLEKVSWRNPSTGVVSTVSVPMPERLVSALQANPAASDTSVYGIELLSLRKAHMLENYLKRIYYGGDEYRDRMLHLYGARIEDYRINRPQWLSSSLDEVDPKQEVANTGVAPTSTDPDAQPIGSRIATATAQQSGKDGFTEYCPEFGLYISMLSVMPHVTYDPYLLQNLQTKYTDFPIPQFANQMEDVASTMEISRQVAHSAFGYMPYGHAYRYRVDEVHGDYHDDKYDYCFLRFFDAQNIPNLSWSFIHCRPKLPMFVDSILLNGQCYGTFKHNFLVERDLPSPVETI